MADNNNTIGWHFIRQRDALLRFLTRRTRDPDIAQDLLQETWIRVNQGAGVAVDNPRGYLFQIAGNLAIDHFRSERRRLLRSDEIEALLALPDDSPTPEAIVISRSELGALSDALNDIPHRRRAILLMSRVQGLTHRAIADHFGVSTRTVEFEIVRALNFCKARLKQISASDSDQAD